MDETVEIWQGELDSWNHLLPEWEKLLKPDERTRACRYYFEKDRRRFTAGRALLRLILGYRLGKDPASLIFHYSKYGRPFLKEGTHSHPLTFNLSHSHGRFLLAVALKRRVGVDVEFIRPDVSFDSIALRYFSLTEREAVLKCQAESKPFVFFRYWTLKEAFIKAQGTGLSYPLNRFSVQWLPEESRASLCVPDKPTEASRWSLCFLKSPSSFVAALAIEGPLDKLQHHSPQEMQGILGEVKRSGSSH